MGSVRKSVLGLLLVSFCLSPANPAFADQTHKGHKAAPVPVVPQPASTPEPLVPLTLQQMPAAPPQVSYDHGQLMIVAHNATLGDILRAVRDQTGANMDVPGNATERVVGRMGPGSPRDVLAQLLNGSNFNYVILGTAADPGKLDKVILSVKPADADSRAAQAPPNAAPPPQPAESGFGLNQQPATDDDDDSSETSETGSPGQPPTQAPIRTPEQLLQELQRQQQQQQQPQAPPPPGNPPDRK